MAARKPPLAVHEGIVTNVYAHDIRTEKPWLAVGVDFDEVNWSEPIPVDFAQREHVMPGTRVAMELRAI